MCKIRLRLNLFTTLLLLMIMAGVWGQEGFRVFPYLQNPAPDAMTIIWFSETDEPGDLMWGEADSPDSHTVYSVPVTAGSLSYPEWEDTTYFNGNAPQAPFRHRVRLKNLSPSTLYSYRIVQGSGYHNSTFRTAPAGDSAIRLIVYADSETEPESAELPPVNWPEPDSGSDRSYLVDQNTGYRNNLEVIMEREPDLVFIAGDLVQSGGEQRDWDEFWRHKGGCECEPGLAGRVPLLAALGNHEYYSGPSLGGYDQPASEEAVARYLEYFEYPPNGSSDTAQEGRYYTLRYGPVTYIAIDACNNGPNEGEFDTNFYLLGEEDENGGHAPGFSPGSEQYAWLEEQLAEAQDSSLFTFVMMHHAPYSTGPHGLMTGSEEGFDTQSGVPVRQLTPLFLQYGVDAVFSGHDEMWERSEVTGTEVRPDSTRVPHTIHFYDVGVGGDGLRGPFEGAENPYRVFLAHNDSPEVWEDSLLVSGGKHYGHLEVDVVPLGTDSMQAILTPVYILPVQRVGESVYAGYERREYSDQVVLVSERIFAQDTTTQDTTNTGYPDLRSRQGSFFSTCYPNPFSDFIRIGFRMTEQAEVSIHIFDQMGRRVHTLVNGTHRAGNHEVTWDGGDANGMQVPRGIYHCTISSGKGLSETRRIIRL